MREVVRRGVPGVVPLDFDVVCEVLEAREADEDGRGIEKRLKPGPLLAQRSAEVVHEGFACSAILGALTMGCIGFLFGCFGPIIFTPQSNQGPLLGIFITGPLGFLLGTVVGTFYWFARP